MLTPREKKLLAYLLATNEDVKGALSRLLAIHYFYDEKRGPKDIRFLYDTLINAFDKDGLGSDRSNRFHIKKAKDAIKKADKDLNEKRNEATPIHIYNAGRVEWFLNTHWWRVKKIMESLEYRKKNGEKALDKKITDALFNELLMTSTTYPDENSAKPITDTHNAPSSPDTYDHPFDSSPDIHGLYDSYCTTNDSSLSKERASRFQNRTQTSNPDENENTSPSPGAEDSRTSGYYELEQIIDDGRRTYYVDGRKVTEKEFNDADRHNQQQWFLDNFGRPIEETTSEPLPASSWWLFGQDPNLQADRHVIPTHQGADPDTLPDAAHQPWEDPFSPWSMPQGFDRFTQQIRPVGSGELSPMPDEEQVAFGAYLAGVRSGERILTDKYSAVGFDSGQEKAAMQRALSNPRMNTSQPKQRANGNIVNWNPKLPDDL